MWHIFSNSYPFQPGVWSRRALLTFSETYLLQLQWCNNKLIKINIDDNTFCSKEGGPGKSLADQVIGQNVFFGGWLQDQINADDSDVSDESDDVKSDDDEGDNVQSDDDEGDNV